MWKAFCKLEVKPIFQSYKTYHTQINPTALGILLSYVLYSIKNKIQGKNSWSLQIYIESQRMAEAGSWMAPIAALCGLVVVYFCSLCNVIEAFSVREFSQDWCNICFLVPCPFNQRCCLCACGNYGPPSQGHQFSLGKCYCSGPAQSTQPKTKTKIRRRKYGNLVHHS